MKKVSVLVSFLMLLALSVSVNAQEWSMKKARIMTEFSESIDPNNVLPEYPRPQMQRGDDSWMNLNGIWDIEKVSKRTYDKDQKYTNKILVPFPIESAISGLMWTNFEANKGQNLAYRRTFKLKDGMMDEGKKVLLHFGGVGWLCEVYVNGNKVGQHTGEFDPFYFDITKHLKEGEEQELVVFVVDWANHGGYPSGKQKTNEKGIWYSPSTGIWQTVWVESVNQIYIQKLTMTPDIDKSQLTIKVQPSAAPTAYSAEVEIYDGKTMISKTSNIKLNSDKAINVSPLKLWSPDSPFLYDMKVKLYNGDKLVDTVDSYFGMRKISTGTFAGKPCVLLNNEYIFQHGVLDQGYWPDGIFTAPTDEALKYDLEVTKKFGMNMSRKHIKVEPARWFYHCDKLGLLVWQDMPNAEGDPKNTGLGFSKVDNYHEELSAIIRAYENHPCIVMWVTYNEGWAQPNEGVCRQSVDRVRNLDKNRLVSIASGWHDYEYGDIKDTHWYPAPNLYPNPKNKRVSVCGEYGGITLRVKDHQWLGGSNMQYTEVKSGSEFRDLFNEHTTLINGLGTMGISAAVYTQITDVEDEENGLMTYDRKVIKVNDAQMKEIAEKIKHNYTHATIELVPTSEDQTKKATWKYQMTNSAIAGTDWAKSTYDDSSWQSGQAPFGNDIKVFYGHNDQPTISNWKSGADTYIYLRREVDFGDYLTPDNLRNLGVKIFHDDDCDVYLNGVLVGSWSGYTSRYVYKYLSYTPLRNAINWNGPNTVAVRVRQGTGGQFIDLGFCLIDVERKAFMDTTPIETPEASQPEAELHIAPNPADSEFTLSTDGSEPIASVQLFDITGKLVKSFPAQTSYNIEDILNGLYIVTAQTTTRQLSGRLFIQ